MRCQSQKRGIPPDESRMIHAGWRNGKPPD
jgi:hypothetical protein